tara:strand:+ start:1829 stop:3244 length:1416 start_codon:yes stop_codon:yes gene_type:complete
MGLAHPAHHKKSATIKNGADMSLSTPARNNLIARELKRIDGHTPRGKIKTGKHLKMAANPFRFLRGAAQLFYADLKSGALTLPDSFNDRCGITTVMGDCHVANFGLLTEEGSHGDTIIFCPNDFDDACIGLAGWDLTRFCSSLFLAADYADGIIHDDYDSDEITKTDGLKATNQKDARAAAKAFLKSYRKALKTIISDPDARRMAVDTFEDDDILADARKKALKRAAGGKNFETKSSLGKAVERTAEGPRFRDRPERFKRLDAATYSEVKKMFRPYVDDSVLDIVLRLDAGTGSVNMDRYYLLVGPDAVQTVDDFALCHIVEVKQQREAAPIHHFPDISPNNALNPAHLSVDCQRVMQRRPDMVLDEAVWRGAHWLIRSRHHTRVGLDPEDICLAQKKPGKQLKQYAKACGTALALAHARGDLRSTRFERHMADAIAKDADALIDAAEDYADQSMVDCLTLQKMVFPPVLS